jgi:hypothetical protein
MAVYEKPQRQSLRTLILLSRKELCLTYQMLEEIVLTISDPFFMDERNELQDNRILHLQYTV